MTHITGKTGQDRRREILVSVVVTCYNRADMVTTALDSVRNQTYRPLELIVVDDGSKDNSMAVIEDWRTRYPDREGFTSIAKSFPNGKLCAARNRGLALAHGDYIQYVDDDDWLYPNAIADKISYAVAHSDLDLIVNQLDYVRNGEKFNRTCISLPRNGENLILWLFSHDTLLSATLMFKTEILRKIGGWKDGLLFGDDMEITMRLAILGGKIGMVDKCLSAARIHNLPSQCRTIRKSLPHDFYSNFYGDLHKYASDKGVLSEEVNIAFAEVLRHSAVYCAKIGDFIAASHCMECRFKISGSRSWKGLDYRCVLVKFDWYILHLSEKIKCVLKRVFHALHLK